MNRRRKHENDILSSDNFELPPEEKIEVKNNKSGSVIRNERWEKIDAGRKRQVVKFIIETLPELKLVPQRMLQLLRLLYVSNSSHISGLEKALNGQILNKKDLLPASESVEMMPVLYPETGGIEETEDGKLIAKQILSPLYSMFIENVKKGMTGEQAAIASGFSKTAMDKQLKMIINPNPNPIINSVQYKQLLIVWKAYWDAIKERIEAAGISEDFVLSRLKRTAEFNIKEIFDENGNMRDINTLDDDVAKMITKIRVTETKYAKKAKTETRTISIEFGNRSDALSQLAKLQKGIFNHVKEKTVHHNHQGQILHGKVVPAKMDNETLDKLIALDENNKDKLITLDDDIVDAEFEEKEKSE
jgi:hypothetical protein